MRKYGARMLALLMCIVMLAVPFSATANAEISSSSTDVSKLTLKVKTNDDNANRPRHAVIYFSDSIEDYYVDETDSYNISNLIIYRKRAGKKWYRIATVDSPRDLSYNDTYTDKNLRPNTKFYYKVKYTIKDVGTFVTNSCSCWTPPENCYKAKSRTGLARWRKAKGGCTGYIVGYSYKQYRGINLFGQKVYKVFYRNKIVKKNRIRLKSGQKVTSYGITPYAKHGKKFYVYGYDCVFKSKKQMIKQMIKWELLLGGSEFIYK